MAAGGAIALIAAGAGISLPLCRAAADPAHGAPVSGLLRGEDAELGARLAASRITIGGERLDAKLLRRFYEGHGDRPVWDNHPIAAKALWGAVLRARSQGLDPALFHAGMWARRGLQLSAAERDLLLSDAFLGYAEALARGAVPVEARADSEGLAPAPVDVVAVLDEAIGAHDPARTIEALAPASADYQAMRRAYAASLAAAETPALDRRVRDGRAAAEGRLRQLAVNLERIRWLPRVIPADRVVVDTALETVALFRADRPVFTARVVVGETDKQTPEFRTTISDILFNPPWNIPRSILEKEILPKLRGNPGYLSQHHMRWRGSRLQQEAGAYSALGRIKFEMADRYDVYLHDTPEKWRFGAASRMMSHGCVRVENPRTLAALLLGSSPEEIDKAIGLDRTHSRALPQPLPVFIVYRTAYVESNGQIAFRGDPYGRDEAIWRHLNRASDRPVAQDTAFGHRKG
jgi:murein L,D-transpeptidase YcbB/YkuD